MPHATYENIKRGAFDFGIYFINIGLPGLEGGVGDCGHARSVLFKNLKSKCAIAQPQGQG